MPQSDKLRQLDEDELSFIPTKLVASGDCQMLDTSIPSKPQITSGSDAASQLTPYVQVTPILQHSADVDPLLVFDKSWRCMQDKEDDYVTPGDVIMKHDDDQHSVDETTPNRATSQGSVDPIEDIEMRDAGNQVFVCFRSIWWILISIFSMMTPLDPLVTKKFPSL